jgi:hypothetical protein
MYDIRAGVRAAKFVADGTDLAVGVHVRSERSDPVVVRIREQLPASVPVAALTFESDRWTVADGDCLYWTGVVEGAQVVTYECPLPIDFDREAFHTRPVVESVQPAMTHVERRRDRPAETTFREVRAKTEPMDLARASPATCDATFSARTDAVAFEDLV